MVVGVKAVRAVVVWMTAAHERTGGRVFEKGVAEKRRCCWGVQLRRLV